MRGVLYSFLLTQGRHGVSLQFAFCLQPSPRKWEDGCSQLFSFGAGSVEAII